MAVDKLVDSALLDAALGDIADVIRSKTGISGSFDFPTPNDFADAIDEYLIRPTGTKSITQNGTNIDVAQYSKVDVNVSGGGGSNIKSGSITLVSNSNSETINTGIDFSHFVIFEMDSANVNNSSRVLRFAHYNDENKHTFSVSSNNSGASVALDINYTTAGLSKSGTNAVYNKSGTAIKGGLEYTWFAW